MSKEQAYRQGLGLPPEVDAMAAYLEGKLPEADAKALEAWLAGNPGYADALDGLREIKDPQAVHAALYRMRKSVRKRLDIQRDRPEKNGKPRKFPGLPKHFVEITAATAAAVGLLVMSVFIILQPGKHEQQEMAMAESYESSEEMSTESAYTPPMDEEMRLESESGGGEVSRAPAPPEAVAPTTSTHGVAGRTSPSVPTQSEAGSIAADPEVLASVALADAEMPEEAAASGAAMDDEDYGMEEQAEDEEFGSANEDITVEDALALDESDRDDGSASVRMGNALPPEQLQNFSKIPETDLPVMSSSVEREEQLVAKSRTNKKEKNRRQDAAQAAPMQAQADHEYGQASQDSVLADLFAQAVVHYDAGEYSASESLLNEVLTSRNQDAGARLYRSRIRRYRGDYRDAIDDLKVAERDSQSEVYYLAGWELALAYLDWDKDKKAAKQLKKIVDEAGPYAPDAEVLLDSLSN